MTKQVQVCSSDSYLSFLLLSNFQIAPWPWITWSSNMSDGHDKFGNIHWLINWNTHKWWNISTVQTRFGGRRLSLRVCLILIQELITHRGKCASLMMCLLHLQKIVPFTSFLSLPLELMDACLTTLIFLLPVFQVCPMLCSLENYYWRYTSASELVNMILAFVETRAYQVGDFVYFAALH